VYLKNYQFLPYARTCELLGDFLGCPMSEGTLANLIGECHERLEVPVQQIKERIAQAPVAQFDESGSRVEKKLWWLHAASTPTATYYDIHPKRGTEAIEAIGILPNFGGRAIHDFCKPYFSYGCAHGLCNAHHLRELIFVHEQHQQNWADTMIDCLLDIKAAVALARPTTYHLTKAQIQDFEARYQSILDEGYAANPLAASPASAEKKRGRRKKTKPRNLLERLDEHRHEALAFMYDFNVPFDNNLTHAASGMSQVMPTPGLCRVPRRADTTVGRITVPGQPICRHYQRPSRKASKGSGGLYRVGARPLALACASARSLSRMSACKYICVVSDDS